MKYIGRLVLFYKVLNPVITWAIYLLDTNRPKSTCSESERRALEQGSSGLEALHVLSHDGSSRLRLKQGVDVLHVRLLLQILLEG